MPGDPDTVEALARRLGTYAEGAGQAAARLRAIDSGAWVGEAADAFRAAIEEIPAKLERGAGAFAEAAEALGSYAGVLRAAQATAAQVAAMVADADAQSATWSTRRDAYQAALAQAQAIGVPPPADVPPALDPGAAGRDHAARVLESARGEVAAAAGRSAARLRAAAAAAPNEPGLLSRLWHGVSEFGAGVVEGSWGMATFVFKLSPAYLAIDPEGYAEHLQGLSQGLVYGLTHPVEFAQAVVDWDTWAESPGRALGHLVPDLALTLATGGGASLLRGRAAASRLARAGEKVEKLRSVERTVDKVEDLSDLSAAQRAARLQGKDAYSGVDKWTNRIAQPGERFAVGYPGLSGFGVPEHVLDDVGNDARQLFEGVQAAPRRVHPDFPTNRPEAVVYEIKQPLELAEAKAAANPRWGDGGLDQMFVPDIEAKELAGVIEEVDTRPLTSLRARFEDPTWTEVDPSLPHSPPLTVAGEQRIGFAEGAALGATTAVAAEAADAGGGDVRGGFPGSGGDFDGAGISDNRGDDVGQP